MSDRIINSNDIKIHYRIQRGKGHPLIFLHGGGGSLSAWEVILPYFNQNSSSTILTVDLRGHGFSDKPKEVKDYSLEKHAEDILKILEQEKLDKVIMIGHCLGSMVAATFAAISPLKVEKLILINTNFELPWFICRSPIKQILYTILDFIKYLVPFKVTSKKRVDYSKFIGSFDIDLQRLRNDLDVMGAYSAIRQSMALLMWNGKKYFTEIKVPTLVIAGTHDLFYQKGSGERIVKLIPGAKLEYVDSNHISVINNSQEIYDKLVKFI